MSFLLTRITQIQSFTGAHSIANTVEWLKTTQQVIDKCKEIYKHSSTHLAKRREAEAKEAATEEALNQMTVGPKKKKKLFVKTALELEELVSAPNESVRSAETPRRIPASSPLSLMSVSENIALDELTEHRKRRMD